MNLMNRLRRDWERGAYDEIVLRCGRLLSIQLLCIAALAGCGDYGSGSKQQQPVNLKPSISKGLTQAQRVKAFESTLYPIVTSSCGGGCHDTGADAPFMFAHPDAGSAWSAATQFQKVNLNDPPDSAVVRKMWAGHNCAPDCQALGDEMTTQIEAWRDIIAEATTTGPQVSVSGILSNEVSYISGEELKLGERYRKNMIAFYDFTEGVGDVAHDTSGVGPAMDLKLTNTEWMGSYGIEMTESHARADKADSLKLYEMIAKPGYGSQQFTFEAWVNNANITQERAHIINYTRSKWLQNFSLKQHEYLYAFRNRSMAPGSEPDGRVALVTKDRDAQESLQHIVITYDPVRGRRIYIDSQFTGDVDPLGGARLWEWQDDYQFSLGVDGTGSKGFWRGQFRMLAVYNQALTDGQIRQNFLAGVGKSLRLTFSLNQWTGDDTEVQFEVSEFDSQSYLLCQPTFVGSNLDGLHLKNMRIAINPATTSAPPSTGQAFVKLDMMLTGASQQVSRNCTMIAKDKGPSSDSFVLVFEELAYFQDLITPIVYTYKVTDTDPSPGSAVGVRDFSAINATMQDMMGVDPLLPRAVNPGIVDPIQTIYEELRGQLPPTSDPMAFVPAHQVGITRLAFEYCTEMVDDTFVRQAVFGAGFDSFFNSDVATSYGNVADTTLVVETLTDMMLNSPQLDDQPIRADVISTLEALAADLRTNCGVCDADRTRSITKGLCTAVLASAAVLVQ